MSERVVLKPGATVAIGEHQDNISQVLDLETVLVHDHQSGEARRLKLGDLAPAVPEPATPPSSGEADLVMVADALWRIAQRRFNAIRPLRATPHGTRTQVAECARMAEVNIATIYRWRQRDQQSGHVAALRPSERRGGRGQSRLSSEVEALVQTTIEEVSLSTQKPSVQHTCREVIRRCRHAALIPPPPNTVRYRIRHLSDKGQLRRRAGGRATADKYAPS